jgi:hypothetical protein
VRRAAATAIVLAVVCLATPSARAEDEAADVVTPAVTVNVVRGRLSLEARAASLPEILDAIADRTDLRVQLDRPAEALLDSAPITITLRDVPVEEALRRLLRGRDFVLVSGSGRPAEARLYSHREASPAASPAASPGSAPPGEAIDRTNVAALRRQALDDPNPRVRARALEGLAANADHQAARDAVLAVLERESNAGLLQRALDIVGGDATIPLEPLVKLALANPSPEVRVKALTQLAGHVARDPRARTTLEAAAAEDATPSVRDAARALLQPATPR